MQDERPVEYIEDIYQDTGRLRERIWAIWWTNSFENLGEHSSLAVEILYGINRHLGHHTTEVLTVYLAWNLDSSGRRKCNPQIRICDHQISGVDGEKGLSRKLSESEGCRLSQMPKGPVLNGSHRSLILFWVPGVNRR